jgi:hypothetical protein
MVEQFTGSIECMLRYLGFSRDTWGETVVVFYRDNDIVNIMPLGLKILDENMCTLYGRILRGSKFYNYIVEKNLSDTKCCICISQEPQLFYYAVFEKNKLVEIFSSDKNFGELCDAYLTSICRFDIKDYSVDVVILVKEIIIKRRYPRVFTRASATVIEALVWLTKISYIECNNLKDTLKYIEFLRTTVYRSSQNKLYNLLIDSIYGKALELVKQVESSRCRSGDKNF